ncbi:type II secretion system F family protein [Rhabdothermincola salaria]|uniref:type II secretion system F family protein n=1 Tax=Rhabdothermincola salaria TaxID=2903142 RepID=UPI001E633D66|nr:type II secretion system F family protein [Rhabdothermincola salaria]MCD9622366.1 type II secretion system F family protein [Rhabdothermincola salaria]
MTRLVVPAALATWIGTALLLSNHRWFRRVSLAERLRPYVPGAAGPNRALRSPGGWAHSVVDVLGPLARSGGATLARLFGVSEELSLRLRRVHSPLDPTAFRLRQLGWVVGAFGLVVVLVAAVRPPVALVVLAVLGAPLLAFLVVEQQLARASAAWQHRLFLELPVVSEQLGMLLSAGYSLGAALTRLSQRSSGAVAHDLRGVVGRVQQGLDDVAALREWATVARLPAVDRLVAVLALNREASDLGHLISEEARSLRADVHRELIEAIERRGQQVWIPVTVATLLPGVLFLAVPFIEAMQLFTSG